jgi:putative oxidoreductase
MPTRVYDLSWEQQAEGANQRPHEGTVLAVSLMAWGAALLILRLTAGVIFIAHGWPKLVEKAGTGHAISFARHGIPFAQPAARLAGLVQVLGGASLAAGFATRLAAVPLGLVMVVAIVAVKRKSGFTDASDFPLLLLAVCLVLALVGPGPWAISGLP